MPYIEVMRRNPDGSVTLFDLLRVVKTEDRIEYHDPSAHLLTPENLYIETEVPTPSRITKTRLAYSPKEADQRDKRDRQPKKLWRARCPKGGSLYARGAYPSKPRSRSGVKRMRRDLLSSLRKDAEYCRDAA